LAEGNNLCDMTCRRGFHYWQDHLGQKVAARQSALAAIARAVRPAARQEAWLLWRQVDPRSPNTQTMLIARAHALSLSLTLSLSHTNTRARVRARERTHVYRTDKGCSIACTLPAQTVTPSHRDCESQAYMDWERVWKESLRHWTLRQTDRQSERERGARNSEG
jgi:hypothetical protein